MTVKELLDKLKELEPNSKVVRVGHNGGYEDIFTISKDQITDNFTKESCNAVVID